MGRYQLVFRRAGKPDTIEVRFNDGNGEARINGHLVVDGEVYVIHGVEWFVHREDFQLHRGASADLPRFICTLVVEPTSD